MLEVVSDKPLDEEGLTDANHVDGSLSYNIEFKDELFLWRGIPADNSPGLPDN